MILKGVVASCYGKNIVGVVYNYLSSDSKNIPKDYILVIDQTNPDLLPIMKFAKAIVTEYGGLLSHAAIVSREFNIPCIVGVSNVTNLLKNNDKIKLNMINGEIIIVK